MSRRVVAYAKTLYDTSREGVHTASVIIEENKSILWILGTASSALGGWAVYTLRRLHYSKIEGEMSSISERIESMRQHEEERQKLEGERHGLEGVIPGITTPNLMLVGAPAIISAFLFGYIVGRTSTSYKWHRQMRLSEGLSKQRVFVAVVPEHNFDASNVARELERAVIKARKESEVEKKWLHSSKLRSSALVSSLTEDTPFCERRLPSTACEPSTRTPRGLE